MSEALKRCDTPVNMNTVPDKLTLKGGNLIAYLLTSKFTNRLLTPYNPKCKAIHFRSTCLSPPPYTVGWPMADKKSYEKVLRI